MSSHLLFVIQSSRSPPACACKVATAGIAVLVAEVSACH